MPKPITHDGWTLTDKDGTPVMIGQQVSNFRGDTDTLVSGTSPAGHGKSGYVRTKGGAHFYPHVFGLRWVSPEGRYFGDGK